MTEMLTTFFAASAALLFWEIVKMFAVAAFKSEAPKAVARGLQILDEILPAAIYEGHPSDVVEAQIRARLGALTGQEWADIRQRFDPVVFLDTLKQ
jgi:hypothetical protein